MTKVHQEIQHWQNSAGSWEGVCVTSFEDSEFKIYRRFSYAFTCFGKIRVGLYRWLVKRGRVIGTRNLFGNERENFDEISRSICRGYFDGEGVWHAGAWNIGVSFVSFFGYNVPTPIKDKHGLIVGYNRARQ